MDDLINLLKMSKHFKVPDVHQLAVLLLDHHPHFADILPVEKFLLCIEASVPQWFKATYTALARQSLVRIIGPRGHLLGISRIQQLNQLRKRIRIQCFTYANSKAPAPQVISDHLKVHLCHSVWKDEVWGSVVLHLLQSSDTRFRDEMTNLVHMARQDVADRLKDGEMCDECFVAYVERLEECGFIGGEEMIVEEHVRGAFALQCSLSGWWAQTGDMSRSII